MKWVRCEEGVNTRERIAVTSDALNIAQRLKEIDPDYFVMFNRITQKFEVHVKGQLCTIGCELPFDQLDARTLIYVREHHSSRADAIMDEINRAEEAAEREKAARMQEIHDRAAEGFAYAAKSRTTDAFPVEAAEGLNDESEGTMRGGGRIHRPTRRLCNHYGQKRQASV